MSFQEKIIMLKFALFSYSSYLGIALSALLSHERAEQIGACAN